MSLSFCPLLYNFTSAFFNYLSSQQVHICHMSRNILLQYSIRYVLYETLTCFLLKISGTYYAWVMRLWHAFCWRYQFFSMNTKPGSLNTHKVSPVVSYITLWLIRALSLPGNTHSKARWFILMECIYQEQILHNLLTCTNKLFTTTFGMFIQTVLLPFSILKHELATYIVEIKYLLLRMY